MQKIKLNKLLAKLPVIIVIALTIVYAFQALAANIFNPTQTASALSALSVSPSSGPTTGGETVTITGEGFDPGWQWTQISAGSSHTCALDSNGQAYCWGGNWSGGLGNGNTDGQLTPVAVVTSGALSGKTLTQISAGSSHTCALDSNGQAYCWGGNWSGGLGNGNTDGQLTPVAVNISALPPTPINLQVTLGGSPCINIQVLSDTELTCTTTAHLAGIVDVIVGSSLVTTTLRQSYTYTNIGAPNTGKK